MSVMPGVQALKADPKMAESYNNMASHLQALGRMEEAVQAFKVAVEIRPDRWVGISILVAIDLWLG